MKVFSGSEVLALGLKEQLEAIPIQVEKKDNIQSGRLAGFGTLDLAVELFIQETDFNKANPIIEAFRMSL